MLFLDGNGLGSAGLIALAPRLRARPQLKKLYLVCNGIGDDGLAALVAPGEGVLPSLEELWLHDNQVGDVGASALASAIRGGVMPALIRLSPPWASDVLDGNPASPAAKAALASALADLARRRR